MVDHSDARSSLAVEIQTQLRRHPTVAQAAVTVKSSSGSGQASELKAYVVPVVEQGVDTEELYRYLRERLQPGHVPSRIHVVDLLQRDESGHIDWEALERHVQSTAPVDEIPDIRTDVEERLTRIWESLLRRSNVGLDENFVRLGGDSLQMLRMITLVREEFGQRLKVEDVLREPTIRNVGQLLKDAAEATP